MVEAVHAGNLARFREICGADNFGCRILSSWSAFGDDPALTTMVSDGGAALSFKGGAAVVCGQNDPELTECLAFLGCREIFSPAHIGYPPGYDVSTGPVALLSELRDTDFGRAEKIDAEKLREIWPVIVSDLPGIVSQPFGEWYVELSHRLRHGNARIYAVREGGKIVSVAMTAAESDFAAVIGFVRTLKEYRGRGFASGLCAVLGNELLREKKRVYISCGENRLSFYESIGYRKVFDWKYGKKREENE
ncbi:MAG: GNAT family N-acetyltransferase [Clostridia bacterium]|nr:GNAT family N-acetyltransferase [Clostridia bacterium]